MLFSSPEAIRLIQAIRSNHALYSEYQHTEMFVSIVNSFAHTEWNLPAGWEKKINPKTKKVCALLETTHSSVHLHVWYSVVLVFVGGVC